MPSPHRWYTGGHETFDEDRAAGGAARGAIGRGAGDLAGRGRRDRGRGRGGHRSRRGLVPRAGQALVAAAGRGVRASLGRAVCGAGIAAGARIAERPVDVFVLGLTAAAAATTGEIAVRDSVAAANNWRPGDRLRVVFPDGATTQLTASALFTGTVSTDWIEAPPRPTPTSRPRTARRSSGSPTACRWPTRDPRSNRSSRRSPR